MSRVAIPAWNGQGVLPPRNHAAPTSYDRSPYQVALTDVVLRYATSPERRRILEGYLRFREKLDSIGLHRGFQWLDGSFLENIEQIESRPPGDIDVVTLFHLPPGFTQLQLLQSNPAVFNPILAKSTFSVDAYFVELNASNPEFLIRQTNYWYSLLSHRRNDIWKGYLQVDLSPSDNGVAQANLVAMSTQGGTP